MKELSIDLGQTVNIEGAASLPSGVQLCMNAGHCLVLCLSFSV